MRELRNAERKRERVQLKLKKRLLAGDSIEPGRFTAELRLLLGRKIGSKNPDDYELVLIQVH